MQYIIAVQPIRLLVAIVVSFPSNGIPQHDMAPNYGQREPKDNQTSHHNHSLDVTRPALSTKCLPLPEQSGIFSISLPLFKFVVASERHDLRQITLTLRHLTIVFY